MYGEIINMPDKLNVDLMISKKIDDIYKKCEFCYQSLIKDEYSEDYADILSRRSVEIWSEYNGYTRADLASYYDWYDSYKPLKGFFGKRYVFVHKIYKCTTCNAKWYSIPYPVGIMYDVIKEINKTKKKEERGELLNLMQEIAIDNN